MSHLHSANQKKVIKPSTGITRRQPKHSKGGDTIFENPSENKPAQTISRFRGPAAREVQPALQRMAPSTSSTTPERQPTQRGEQDDKQHDGAIYESQGATVVKT